MASVTFSAAVGGDGSTVTDDTNASTGLDNYGYVTRFVPALGQFVAVAANTVAQATAAAASAASALNAPGTNATSTTSLTIGTGNQVLTIQTGKAYVVGQTLVIASTASPANQMTGIVTAYNSGTGALTVNVSQIAGSGTFAAWTVSMGVVVNSTLPSQTGNNGKFLTTNGTAASWSAVLVPTNNLSDLGSVSTARTNLGLGTSATVNTGTSGATIPLLNAANTWGAKQTTAPSTTGGASLNIADGTAPTSPVSGDFWAAAGALQYRSSGGSTKTLMTTDGNTTGSAATLTTSRSLTITGDGAWTVNFNGSANVSASLTLATVNSNVGSFGDGFTVPAFTVNAKGLVTAVSAVSIPTLVGDSGSGGTKGLAPAPAAGDAALNKYLRADGTWGQAFFESAPISFVAAQNSTALAHGLGVKPKRVELYLQCVSAQLGHAVGDEVRLGGISSNNGAEAWIIDATNLGYVVGSAGIGVLNGTTGTFTTVTAANWRIIIRAWAA